MVLILLYPVLGHLNLGSLPYLPQRPPFISGPCSSLLALCRIHLNINTFFSYSKKKKNPLIRDFRLQVTQQFLLSSLHFFASQVSIDVVCVHSLHSPGWLPLFSFTLQSTVVRLLSPSLYRYYSQQGHSLLKTI